MMHGGYGGYRKRQRWAQDMFHLATMRIICIDLQFLMLPMT
jgi:hypothetical protein